MKNIFSWSVMSCASAVLFLASCATTRIPQPMHFYASHNLDDDPVTAVVFNAVDTRMRTEAGFLRDFDNPMHIQLANGVPIEDGKLRFDVTISIERRLFNRRISERDRILTEFSVTCAADRPQPCVDGIAERARLQPARIARIVARSPKV